jgi:glycine hydroxymethyltransferase
MSDFIVRGSLSEIDPNVSRLIELEAERQARKIILIPSESLAPVAVREALGSVFQNLYAEGYPDEDTRWMTEEEIVDYTARLSHYRRYSDPRYYKGVEYADIIESLARRRCAEAFAANSYTADQIYANVQPLSGAPANNAVYTALINPGDTIMGMSLLHGGHLSHGSSVNRSGKLYKVIHYVVKPDTERIDYDAVAKLAAENHPKIIIAGFSSYPWVPDWKRFREIADSVGAILLADISHIAGLTAAGITPSPIGYAHVVTFTTHKTMGGPRGACILTTDSNLAKKLDRAVFPGEQGGPHVHVFAAMATTFKLAGTESFHKLQQQIVANCAAITGRLKERGLHIPYGGTNTHLANIDCKTVIGEDGTRLSGDMAARILDLAGIVMNRNTIPGDKTALFASGLRYGTPWVSQRGMKESEMVKIADIIADVMLAMKPYTIETHQGAATRAKIDFSVLEDAKQRSQKLAESAGIDQETVRDGYPHYFFLEDKPATKGDWVAYDLTGINVRHFVNFTFSADVEDLKPAQSVKSQLVTPLRPIDVFLTEVEPTHYRLSVLAASAGLAATWLRDLSDGFTTFDPDVTRRLPGPIYVTESVEKPVTSASGEAIGGLKPFYIGIQPGKGKSLPEFKWDEKESDTPRRTPLYETHRQLGAKMVPFAGWDMPVWYTSVVEEHLATRHAAGLFDVTHMGVFQAEGPDAATFLDCACGNDIGALAVGESCYTHLLDPHANVIDDLLVYRRSEEKYLVVVNAANDDKDWTWLNAVREGKVLTDPERPWVRAFGRNVILHNLRDPKAGKEMRLDVALQGPKSRDILLSLGCDSATRRKIMALKRTELCEAIVGGFDLVVSRTGYTGEKMAFELFVHPAKAVDFWNALLKAGEPLGLKPCGLGARDSLRTEAGLPLYGHEMAGEHGLGVAEAGFGSYVKTYKPWFVGREAFINREKTRTGEVIRFRFTEKGIRMAHGGDPVIDQKGRVVGYVTSCAVDMEGFLTGQAFLEQGYTAEGTAIAIYQGAAKTPNKAPADLLVGDKIGLPTPAVVVSRFPKL